MRFSLHIDSGGGEDDPWQMKLVDEDGAQNVLAEAEVPSASVEGLRAEDFGDWKTLMNDPREGPGIGKHIGRKLWAAWFGSGEGRNQVGETLLELQHGSPGLQDSELLLCSSDPWVIGLPWELLLSDGDAGEQYLVGAYDMTLARVFSQYSLRPAQCPPVKAWFGLACPAEGDLHGFDTKWCFDEIQSLRERWGVYVESDVNCWPSASEFCTALRENHIVYFVGHGSNQGPPAHERQPGLWLVKSRDTLAGEFLPASDIAMNLNRGDLSLLVLNCCWSVDVALAIYKYWASKTPGPQSLPTIVATQWEWAVPKAFHFQKDLFDALVLQRHASISHAFTRYRSRFVQAEDLEETGCFWATPTVFTGRSKPGGSSGRNLQPIRLTAETPDEAGPLGLSAEQVELLLASSEGRGSPFLPQDAAVRGHWRTSLQQMQASGLYQPQTSVGAFEIDILPVTVQMYERVREGHRRQLAPSAGSALDGWNAPALVTFDDARRFCEIVGGLRLPTRQEWERAARGTASCILPWADADTEAELRRYADQARNLLSNVYEAGQGGLTSVFWSSRGASPYGVRDMIGNAPEWALDGSSAAIMGRGWRYPLIANIPSYFWRPQDPAGHHCSFRCVVVR